MRGFGESVGCVCFAVVVGAGLWVVPAVAQKNSDGSAVSAARVEKQIEFEVFSIRLHQLGSSERSVEYMPDGFRATWPLQAMIQLAYMPRGLHGSSLKILHQPQWAYADWYDIEGRVAPADMAAWAKAGPDFQDSEPLRMALRAALKERCKLAVHTRAVEVPYWNIVVGKRGARLSPTVPGAIQRVPGKTSVAGKGIYIEDNGKRQFVGVSMADLATVLVRLTEGIPVQDKTGLTGRYDFVLPYVDSQHYAESEIGVPLDRMPLSSIGLMLEKGTGPGFVIDIDAIEKPSEN